MFHTRTCQSFRPLLRAASAVTPRSQFGFIALSRPLSSSAIGDEAENYASALARRRLARSANMNPDLAGATTSARPPSTSPSTTKASEKGKEKSNVAASEKNVSKRETVKERVSSSAPRENNRPSLRERLTKKHTTPETNSLPFLIPTNPLYSSPAATLSTMTNGDDSDASPDRPFTLPAGQFRPKQSLGQNYLSDQNYVNKIVDCFHDQRRLRLPSTERESDQEGRRVVEIGPGAGALTRVLVKTFPNMLAVEIDQRAVALLGEKLPEVHVKHQDVLEFDWKTHYLNRNAAVEDTQTHTPSGLSIVANLPYHIVSQVLFSLADHHRYIALAVVTMQYEVAARITAKPRTKEYGIPSVVFQLYGETLLNFKIPPTVFFPVPKVDSALVTVDFTKPHKELKRVHGLHLRKVLTTAFRQRRKMLRQSLKLLIQEDNLTLPEKWTTMRPQELTPVQFIHLTADLYGERTTESEESETLAAVWRRSVHVFD